MTRKSWRWSFSEHTLCPLKTSAWMSRKIDVGSSAASSGALEAVMARAHLPPSPAPVGTVSAHGALRAGLGSPRNPVLPRGSIHQGDHPASCPGEVTQPCHLRDHWWADMATWRLGEPVGR